ncbi:radical SAM/SPASM domain-containing protein [Helicobacter cinaedi]|uniref:radical SAM/SPASM domain-containing protein n=1 Tax=Helicobacter cinaedi TaxID=213 RepID=UPI001EED63C4|nr:radical SAM/SPASM domain-containing protein [Helicobacter cinaedi]
MVMKLKRNKTELTGILGIEKINLLEKLKNVNQWREYRHIYSQVSQLEIITPFPTQIDFELNATCNLRCPMCPLSVEVNSEKKHLLFPFDLFCKIIDEGVAKGLKAIKLNYLNEPLLRNDLEDFIIYAKKAGVLDIYFSSNGLILTKERAKSLINAGLDRIQISIDAYSEDIYNTIRPGSNYHKVVNNVLQLIKLKKELKSLTPLIRVNFVRTEINEHQLDDFIDFWEDKVDMIGSQEMVKPPKSSQDLSSKTTEQKPAFQCSFPYKQLVITAEGNVLPCCTFYGEEMVLGNILTAYQNNQAISLQSFWESSKMQHLREIHKNKQYASNPICKKCIDGAINA